MTRRPSDPSTTERPTGRDEVRTAVLDAATRRFAREGRRASLRDIADDANVNLGLIHRHFGNKDDLLREVLRAQADQGRHSIDEVSDVGDAVRRVFDGVANNDLYVRIIAWLLLEGPTQVQYQDDYPVIAALRALGRGQQHLTASTASADSTDDADVERDVRLMGVFAAAYGWSVFGRQLVKAFGYPERERADLESRLGSLLADAARGDDAPTDER